MKKYNKFTQTLLWLFVACMSAITGCVQDTDLTASFGTTIMKYDAAAQNVPYTITSNGAWTISSDETWCTTSVAEGNGTTSIDIILTANTTSVERTAILTLKCDGKSSTMTVVQSAQLCSLSVSPLALAAGVAEETFDIAITSNTKWVANTEDSWISLDTPVSRATSQSFEGNAFMPITVSKNDTSKDRVGTISIYASSNDGSATLTQTVVVSQSANSTATIVLSTTSLSFGASETTGKEVTYYGTASDVAATTDNSWCSVSVSGSTITVTPTANSTSSASRFAIVTVTATVNGVEATEQITVTQAGATAPEIYLYNSTYSVSASAESATLNWLNLTSTTVEVTSTESWATVSTDYGLSSATVTFAANTEVEARSTTIRIKYSDLLSNTCYKEIQLTQAGVGAPTIFYNDLSLTSAATTAGTFHVIVSNKAATVGTATVTTSSWLTASAAISEGDITVTYTSEANNSDSARENTIYIPVYVGSTLYLCSVNVSQNGLGAPEISTLTNVYVSADAQTHEQSLWITGGDYTNVTYEVYYTYSSTATTATEDWVLGAAMGSTDNTKLKVGLLQNTLNESRSAIITIVAARGASTATVDVMLTQAGTASAGIVGLSQELYVDYKGVTKGLEEFEYINNSTAAISSYTPTTMIPTADLSTSAGKNYLSYVVSEYTGGEAGSYRQGIITLKVTNDNEYPVYYDVLITQTAPEDPSIDAPDVVYIPYAGVGVSTDEDEEVPAMTLPINLLNSAKIDTSASATYLWGTTDTGWLTVTLSTTGVTYTAQPYAGGDGESRSVVVSFYVENSSSNESMCSIEFIQGESDGASASVPAVVTVGYAAQSNSFDVALSNASGAAISEVAYATDNVNLFDTADEKTATYTGSNVSFDVTKNTTTSQRTGHVIVTVSGTNSYDKSVYYVPVTQLTADEVVITAPTSTLGYSNVKAAYSFPISATYDGTVNATASSDGDWIKMKTSYVDANSGLTVTYYAQTYATGLTETVDFQLDAYTGTADYREGFITLSVEDANSSEKSVVVTIRQYKDGSVYVTAPTEVYFGSSALSTTIPVATDSSVVATASSSDWLTIAEADGVYTISATANTSAESREGYISLTVENASGETYTHVITVTQAGTEDASADVPSTINVAAAGVSGMTIDTSNVANMKSATLSVVSQSVDGMITIAEEGVSFDVAANTTTLARYALLKLAVVGTNGNTALYYINVNQDAAATEVISAPTSVLSYGNGLGFYSFPISTLNGATVTATVDSGIFSWIVLGKDATFLGIPYVSYTETTVDGLTDEVRFMLAAYTGTDESRDGFITLSAENAADVIVTIRQYKDGSVYVSAPSSVNVSADAFSVEVPVSTDSSSYTVSASSSFGMTATATRGSDSVTIAGGANTASESREGYVSITVANASGESYTHFITVTQAGTDDASADVPSTVNVAATGAEGMTIDTSNVENMASATLSVVSDVDGIITIAEEGVSFDVAVNGTTEARYALLKLAVVGTNGNTSFYYINVNQDAATSITPLVYVASTITISASSVTDGTIPVTVNAGVTLTDVAVSVSHDVYGIVSSIAYDSESGNIVYSARENVLGAVRSATVALTVTSSMGAVESHSISIVQTATDTDVYLVDADDFFSEEELMVEAFAYDETGFTHTGFNVNNIALYERGTVTSEGQEGVDPIFSALSITFDENGTGTITGSVNKNLKAVRNEKITLTLYGYNGNSVSYVLLVEQAGAPNVKFVDGTPRAETLVWDATSLALSGFSFVDADLYDSSSVSMADNTIFATTPVFDAVAGTLSGISSENYGPERTATITITLVGTNGKSVEYPIVVTQAACPDVEFVKAPEAVTITWKETSFTISGLELNDEKFYKLSSYVTGTDFVNSVSYNYAQGTITGTVAKYYGATDRTDDFTLSLNGVNGNATSYTISVTQTACPNLEFATVPTVENTLAWNASTALSLSGFTFVDSDIYSGAVAATVTDSEGIFTNLSFRVISGVGTLYYTPTVNYSAAARKSTITVEVTGVNGVPAQATVVVSQDACPDVEFDNVPTQAAALDWNATSFSLAGFTFDDAALYGKVVSATATGSIFSGDLTFVFANGTGTLSGATTSNYGAARTSTITLVVEGINGVEKTATVEVSQAACPDVEFVTAPADVTIAWNATSFTISDLVLNDVNFYARKIYFTSPSGIASLSSSSTGSVFTINGTLTSTNTTTSDKEYTFTFGMDGVNGNRTTYTIKVTQTACPDVEFATAPTTASVDWNASAFSLGGFSFNDSELFGSVVSVSTSGDILSNVVFNATTGTLTATPAVNYGAARTSTVIITVKGVNGVEKTATVAVSQAACPDVEFATVPTTATIDWDASTFSLGGFVLNNVDYYDNVTSVSATGSIFSGSLTFSVDANGNGTLSGAPTTNSTTADRTSTVTITITGKNGVTATTVVEVTQEFQEVSNNVSLKDPYKEPGTYNVLPTLGADAQQTPPDITLVTGLFIEDSTLLDRYVVFISDDNGIFANSSGVNYDPATGVLSLTSHSINENNTGSERTATITLRLIGTNGVIVNYYFVVTQESKKDAGQQRP